MESELRGLTVRQLKDRLRTARLPVSGLKQTLIDRLIAATNTQRPRIDLEFPNDLVGIIAIYSTWEATFRILCLAKELAGEFFRDRIWVNKLDAESEQQYPSKPSGITWLDHYWRRSRLHYGGFVLVTPKVMIPFGTKGYSAEISYSLSERPFVTQGAKRLARDDRARVYVHTDRGLVRTTYTNTEVLTDRDKSNRIKSMLAESGSSALIAGTESTKYLVGAPVGSGLSVHCLIADRGYVDLVQTDGSLIRLTQPGQIFVDYQTYSLLFLDREGRGWTLSIVRNKLEPFFDQSTTNRSETRSLVPGEIQNASFPYENADLTLRRDRTVLVGKSRAAAISKLIESHAGSIQYIGTNAGEEGLILLIDPLTD